jgi:hypothetical protein
MPDNDPLTQRVTYIASQSANAFGYKLAGDPSKLAATTGHTELYSIQEAGLHQSCTSELGLRIKKVRRCSATVSDIGQGWCVQALRTAHPLTQTGW